MPEFFAYAAVFLVVGFFVVIPLIVGGGFVGGLLLGVVSLAANIFGRIFPKK